MSGAFLEYDLAAEVDRLRQEAAWQSGQNARTLAKYDDLRLVVVALQRGTKMAEHKSDGRIAVQVISGHIRIHAAGRTFDLRAGGLLTLERAVPHDVEAIAESALLLTIAWPGRG